MDQVRKVLERYPADCHGGQIESLGAAGGMSGAAFRRWDSPRGRLVLRRWPSEHPTPDGLQFIHSVLRHVAARGLKIVPVPIVTRDGASFVDESGHLWELAPWLPGAAVYERSPGLAKLQAAMKALAEFHLAAADYAVTQTAPRSAGSSRAIANRLARLRDLQRGGHDDLRQAIRNDVWPNLAPMARKFLASLPKAVPLAIARLTPLVDARFPLQPAIRDIWHDHVLFEGDCVSGLIDFGAMQIETVAADVARLLGSLVADNAEGWRDGFAAYAALRPLSRDEFAAVSALDVSGTILAGCNWIHWIYVERRQFEDREQIEARVARLVERITQLATTAT
jgi:homoserine kinase type II